MSLVADEAYIWTLVCGFIISFILALGIGANDVANTFGTSVGAKVLTLKEACILASIFETSGAILLGGKVSETVRKGIIDVAPYENQTELFLAGNVAALSGSCVWLIIATALRVPVSTSHSIVGATVGFALVAHGSKGVDWFQLGMIVLSWFISPVASGFVSLGIFLICEYFILKKDDPMEPGLRWLHIFYGVTIFINFFSIFHEGPEMLYFHRIPLWGTFVIAAGCGIGTAIFVRAWLVPWQRERIYREIDAGLDKPPPEENLDDIEDDEPDPDAKSIFTIWMTPVESTSGMSGAMAANGNINPAFEGSTEVVNGVLTVAAAAEGNTNNSNNTDQKTDPGSAADSDSLGLRQRGTGGSFDSKEEAMKGGVVVERSDSIQTDSSVKTETKEFVALDDKYETVRIFSWLMILTAIFGAFAHGGNDVSNAIGPFVSIWITATTGEVESDELTPIWILLYGGVGISIGLWIWGRRVIETVGEDLAKMTPSSGFTIELGSAFTVLFASNLGLPISTTHCKIGSIVFVGYYRTRNVNWKLFVGIIFAWVVTLPIAGGASAAFMAIFMTFVPH